jgi:hypothetical protein
MSTSAIAKVCVMCGQDVAGRPRTKDQAGRYYCNPCWSSAISKAPGKPQNHAPQAAHHLCCDCGGRFDGEHVYEQDGEHICKRCYSQREESEAAGEEADPLADLASAAAASTPPKVQGELFLCPVCGGQFAPTFMHQSGVCRECLDTRKSPNLSRPFKASAQASNPGRRGATGSLVGLVCTGGITLMLLLFIFMAITSGEDDRVSGAMLIGAPLAISFGWCAFRFAVQRWRLSDLLVPAGVIGLMIVVSMFMYSDMQSEKREALQKEQDALHWRTERRQEERDKAGHMRDLGMTGSDEDLSRTYDRAKQIDDARKSREDRLGR